MTRRLRSGSGPDGAAALGAGAAGASRRGTTGAVFGSMKGPQARAAELAVRAAVGLAKCLENQFLLIGRHADAGVLHGERHPVPRHARHPQGDRAALRELEGVGQQVLQHLPQALCIAPSAAAAPAGAAASAHRPPARLPRWPVRRRSWTGQEGR
ncbi:hypothetical protein G6F68_015018 [Rhizopus microsporus]|nr:hypothetical protein G6F68_015018 [Rhizopus microsporus]